MVDPADMVTASLAVASDSLVRRRFETAYRMYALMLEKDLLGDWVLLQAWGGKFNRLCGHKTVLVPDFESGRAMIESISRRRLQRGYLLAE